MSGLYMKLIGAGVGVLILVGLILGLKHYKSLAESRGEKLVLICQTTRTAADNQKLACGQVAVQIAELGKSDTNLESAIASQNAAVNDLAAKSKQAQAEAAQAVVRAGTRARGAEATAERLRASSRSTVPSSAVCKPSKAVEETWR